LGVDLEGCKRAVTQKGLSHGRVNLAVTFGLVLEHFLMEVLLFLLELDSTKETG
jgi:hypothetical protein